MKHLHRSLLVVLSAALIGGAQEFRWTPGRGEFCAGSAPAMVVGWGAALPADRVFFSAPLVVEPRGCVSWEASSEPHRVYYLSDDLSAPSLSALRLDSLVGATCRDWGAGNRATLLVEWEELLPLFFGDGGSAAHPRGGWLGGLTQARRIGLSDNLNYLFRRLAGRSAPHTAIDAVRDLRVLIRELERENLPLDQEVLINWWSTADTRAERTECPSVPTEWPEPTRWSVILGEQAAIDLNTTGAVRAFRKTREGESWFDWGAGSEWTLLLRRETGVSQITALLKGEEKVKTALRIALPWPPLPVWSGGEWSDSDENGKADRTVFRFREIPAGEELRTLRLWWPDGSLWWSGTGKTGSKTRDGETEWNFSLPETGSGTTGRVRVETVWNSGRVIGELRDGMGPVLQRATVEKEGVELEFSEPVIGLQPEMFRFGLNRNPFADAGLKRRNERVWVLEIDHRKLQPGMPVWFTTTSDAAVVDPEGNLAPRYAEAVELEGEPVISSHSNGMRLDLETMVELYATPSSVPFGSITRSVVPLSALPPPITDDEAMELRLVIPLLSESVRNQPEWNWTLRIFTAQGGEVASTSGIIRCGELSSGCAASPKEGVLLTVPWNMRTDSGRMVASGSYIVQFVIDGATPPEEFLGRVGVIRRDGSEHPTR